ncbi:hypothetical protein llap_5638 [Limosa lapponica baueri]|uniref:Uncharacterized protein n=1 Tax=Limosa lapponica baueri TaxID=1758121 RepID=A0A2I0UDI1_LIMLA|nr:hypothetical protein llap_5638 [Limosa lapponica baueri]
MAAFCRRHLKCQGVGVLELTLVPKEEYEQVCEVTPYNLHSDKATSQENLQFRNITLTKYKWESVHNSYPVAKLPTGNDPRVPSRIVESQNGLGWKGPLKVIESNVPCNGQGHLQLEQVKEYLVTDNSEVFFLLPLKQLASKIVDDGELVCMTSSPVADIFISQKEKLYRHVIKHAIEMILGSFEKFSAEVQTQYWCQIKAVLQSAIILYKWGLFDAEKKENKQKPQTKKPQTNKKRSLFPEEE